jgi:hypothetical protein
MWLRAAAMAFQAGSIAPVLTVISGCDAARENTDNTVAQADSTLVLLLEGRTGPTATSTPSYASRLWTAPVLDSLRRVGVRADSLAVAPSALYLRAGDMVSADTLKVTVFDSAGRIVTDAPFVVEGPERLLGAQDGAFVGRAPGVGELRVEVLLPTTRGRTNLRRGVALTISRPTQ